MPRSNYRKELVDKMVKSLDGRPTKNQFFIVSFLVELSVFNDECDNNKQNINNWGWFNWMKHLIVRLNVLFNGFEWRNIDVRWT